VASRSSEPHGSKLTVVRLPDSVALHARPAGALVRAAAAFAATIEVRANGRRANAKSILEILGLGAGGGTELAISASGDDAAAAVGQLAELVTGFS
jgi:phosphotransferase system HPr (HPr) family protein